MTGSLKRFGAGFLGCLVLFILAACSISGELRPTAAPAEAPLTPGAANSTVTQPAPPGSGSSTAAPSLGQYPFDLGYRTRPNGFAFENYRNDPKYQNLTPVEMRRIYGDRVCARLDQNRCDLDPPAKKWMDQMNRAMGAGHCEGLAVLSLLFFLGRENPHDFGASTTFDLRLDGNPKLQSEIAYWWALQATSPTYEARLDQLTPNQVLETLQASLKGGPGAEAYTIALFKPGFNNGHALTPWAVEARGGGIFGILVYDNNYPSLNRAIQIDTQANTWTYLASTNPREPASEYKGDAETKTLLLVPVSARFQPRVCDFCDSKKSLGDRRPGLAAPAEAYNEVWLDGQADLLITDARGRRYGLADGKFVNEIPELRAIALTSADLWKDDLEPEILIPIGIQFTITLDGSRLAQESTVDLTMIGPQHDVSIEGIKLAPGQKDTIAFSPDGSHLTYRTTRDETPDIIFGLETQAVDYTFLVRGVDLNGGTLDAALDLQKGQFVIHTGGNASAGQYDLEMTRGDQNADQVFAHHDIPLDPYDTVYLNFGTWAGDGHSIPLLVDHHSDGTIDETIDLADEP